MASSPSPEMRSSQPWKLKAADAKIEDQEYFVAAPNPWLDALGRSAFGMLLQSLPKDVPGRQGKLAACFFDEHTLVLVGILEPMQ